MFEGNNVLIRDSGSVRDSALFRAYFFLPRFFPVRMFERTACLTFLFHTSGESWVRVLSKSRSILREKVVGVPGVDFQGQKRPVRFGRHRFIILAARMKSHSNTEGK